MKFIFSYIHWHYTQALRDLLGIILNFNWFFYEFFSITLLFKTLFTPFHRLNERYTAGFHPEKWLETFIANTLMRIVGCILRTALILCGIFFILMSTCFGLVLFCAWLLSPILLLFLIVYGLMLMSSGN